MRALYGYILLISLTATILTAVGWLAYHREMVREQLEHELYLTADESKLVTLTFSVSDSKTELEWEHDREFEYKGQMYDVVSSKSTTDSITYIVIWDRAETKIKKQLAVLLDRSLQDDPEHQSTQQQLQSFLTSLFAEQLFEWHAINPSELKKGKTLYSEKYFYSYQKALSPPPRLV